jgi:hypothetical protein
MKHIDVIIRNLQELKENWEWMEKEVADRMDAQNRYNSANRLLRIRIRMMEGQKS